MARLLPRQMLATPLNLNEVQNNKIKQLLTTIRTFSYAELAASNC